jgi:hypothetical protein
MARVTLTLTDHPVTGRVMVEVDFAPELDTDHPETPAQKMMFDCLHAIDEKHALGIVTALTTEEHLDAIAALAATEGLPRGNALEESVRR